MAKDSVCKKCSLEINAKIDFFTVCEGECAFMFHAKCVNLSEDVLISLSVLSANVVWMCDSCMLQYRKTRDNIGPNRCIETVRAKPIEEEVQELRSTVADILQTLSKIVPHASTNSVKPCHSTPNSSLVLSSKRDANDVNAANMKCNEDQRRSQCSTADSNFSLFLSNIDLSVTEEDVHAMVSRSLGTPQPERIDITKLTSIWNSRRSMDYLSFKVVLDKKWKVRAMDPATWPNNVRFREFVNKNNDTWRPVDS